MEQITFTELRELSYMGASVMHEEAIFPLRRLGIPVRIRNTDEPNAFGTLITPDDTAADRTGLITGLAGKRFLRLYYQQIAHGGRCLFLSQAALGF